MNYLIIVMGSARWDTFQEARTPNIESLGKTEKAHAPSPSTIQSVFSYLYNCGPERVKIYKIGNHKAFRSNLRLIDSIEQWTWLPIYFRNKGYTTLLFTGNPLIYYTVRDKIKDGFDIFEEI